MRAANLLRFGLPCLLAASLLLFLLTACGGRMLNKNMAQDLIANLPGDMLESEDFVVEGVSQTNASNAVVKTRVNAAFRFQKVGGKWILREVRVGNDQWESIDDLVKALRQVKEARTRVLLDTVSEAIEEYCLKNGELPRFNDYDSLSDLLAPEYLNPLIRLDAWERPLHVIRLNVNTVKLVSGGADGNLGSGDDIEVIRTCSSK
jgi:hypothetical protein